MPFPPGTDYFAALGLPRRLNLDPAALEAAYHGLARRHHPDRFATAAPRARVVSLENSALINRAYQALRDPWDRARYAVELAEGARTNAPPQPPAALFEAILNLQDILEERRRAREAGADTAALDERAARAAAPMREAMEGLEGRRDALFFAWDAAEESERPTIAASLKDLLGQRRYLSRGLEEVHADLS